VHATVSIECGKFVSREGITLPTKDIVSTLDMSKPYKYLGIWESNDIKREKVKSSVTFTYKKCLRSLLHCHINGKNLISAIIVWAIPILQHTVGIVD